MKTDPGEQVKLSSPLVHRTCQPIILEEILMLPTDREQEVVGTPVSPVHAAFSLSFSLLTIHLTWHEKGPCGVGRGDNYQI